MSIPSLIRIQIENPRRQKVFKFNFKTFCRLGFLIWTFAGEETANFGLALALKATSVKG